MFQERSDLVDEIKQLEDVKSMLRTTVKKIAKENRLEGKLEGKLEVAQNLLKEKIPVKKIAELTGLSSEEIKKLKK
jgi:predicted transposase/invertase (TIGR01784 family)